MCDEKKKFENRWTKENYFLCYTAPPHTASHVCNYFKTFLYEKPSEKHKQSKQKNQHSSNQFKENNIYDINSSAV